LEDRLQSGLATFSRFRLSHGVGIIDVLIGQMAVDLGASFCTLNQKHYAPIPSLLMLPVRKAK
jgi:predicted nucleic acid-binding protein